MDPSSEKAYAERPSATAGQECIPDFVPGWFNRRGTTEVREAVRILDLANFPIAFLRSDEFVSPAKPGRNGVTIGRRGRDMELAVPPGYWVARDDGGDLFNWHPDEFGVTWSRMMDRPWTPARDREPGVMQKATYDAGSEVLSDVSPAAHAAGIEGWRGTPPAEGTRRRLILDTIESELKGARSHTRCIGIADAIEAALLDVTIGAEEQLAEKRDELIELHRFLDELGAPCGPEISSPTVLNRLRALGRTTRTFTIGEGSEWPLPPGEYEIRACDDVQVEALDPAANTVAPGDTVEAEEPDAPDAEILDSEGHALAGLHVVVGAQDGVPYIALCELEQMFANLYEDITERQAKKQRAELTVTGTIEGWRGTPPAEGTRRALIYGALLGREVLTADECLDHADAVEAALLDSQIAVEAAEGDGVLRDNPYLSGKERRAYEARIERLKESEDQAHTEKELAERCMEDPVDEEEIAKQTWPVGSPERRRLEAEVSEAQRRDNADDRPLWKVELDYGLNHIRNAVASWLGL